MRFSFILPKGASLFVLCMFSLYLVCPSFLVSHFHTPAGLVLIHLLLVMFLRPSIINLSKTDTLCTWTLKLDKINFSPPRLGKQRGEISRVDVRLDEWRMLKTTKGKAEKQATIRRHGGARLDVVTILILPLYFKYSQSTSVFYCVRSHFAVCKPACLSGHSNPNTASIIQTYSTCKEMYENWNAMSVAASLLSQKPRASRLLQGHTSSLSSNH